MIALVCLFAAAAPDPIASTLARQGYVAIPFSEESEDSQPVVVGRIGEKPVRFLIDTASDRSSMLCSAAEKLGMTEDVSFGESRLKMNNDRAVSAKEVFVGSFGLNPHGLPFEMTTCPPAKANKDRAKPIFDAAIGCKTLSFYSTVLDFGEGRLFLMPHGAARANRSDDPLRAELLARGYTAVPLEANGKTGRLLLPCSVGPKKFRGLLATSLGNTIDFGFAIKAGLPLGEPLNPPVELHEENDGYSVALRQLSIGSLDLRTVCQRIHLEAKDLSELRVYSEVPGQPPVGGLIGPSILRNLRAIVDFRTATLYVQPPLRRLWPTIEGRWTAVRRVEDGREQQIDATKPTTVEFKADRCRLSIDSTTETYGIHVLADPIAPGIGLFPPETELAEDLTYPTGARLKLVGDRLFMNVVVSGSSRGLPDALEAPEGSDLMLLEFKRSK